MGFINLLKNGYRGKLGETVGQQWKNQLTVRTYQATNNSKSEAQLKQRQQYRGLIAIASAFWPSTINIKAPKGKSMSDFNYYTSLIQDAMNANMQAGEPLILGQYNRQDIVSPYVFLRDGTCWLYVNLPQGNPKEDFKNITQAVFWSLKGRDTEPYAIDNLLTGKILEKKLKEGVVRKAFPRGYFVETIQQQGDMKNIVATLGRKKGSEIKWGAFTTINPMVHLLDNMMEDL